MVDDKPIQQSKSLFSHALMLMNLLRMVSLGISDYQIELLTIWKTVYTYFKIQGAPLFYSTITRQGTSASNSINIFDNLMLIFAMTYVSI